MSREPIPRKQVKIEVKDATFSWLADKPEDVENLDGNGQDN